MVECCPGFPRPDVPSRIPPELLQPYTRTMTDNPQFSRGAGAETKGLRSFVVIVHAEVALQAINPLLRQVGDFANSKQLRCCLWEANDARRSLGLAGERRAFRRARWRPPAAPGGLR